MSSVNLKGFELYFEVMGEGEPLVFVHGLGSSTKDWKNQIFVFSTSYKTVAFDLRGHGYSGKPAGPYRISMFADDLMELITLLNLRSVHLVGLSLGGCIAFQFALEHPESVRTLTIVNSAPKFGETEEEAEREIERRTNIVNQMGMRAMGESLSIDLFPDPEHTELRNEFVENWSQNNPRAYIEATRSLLGWNIEDKLESIICPTLVISSDEDYTPVDLKAAYVSLMPNARLAVIPGARHFLAVERPQAFNKVLKGFLSDAGSLSN